MLQNHVLEIQSGIKSGQYLNEAAVSQGIVLRILNGLNWPTYDTQIVCPEFTVEGKRVDFALCHPKDKPIVFIEVKQLGKCEGTDRQLFEYAFHIGVPMAIVTDGQEWHFYLPAEQGYYQERRVYKLDILERDVEESVSRLQRYLEYQSICIGKAINSARKDYQNVSKEREIQKSIPVAWRKLIEEHDDFLVEILADKVESICGYKPDLDQIALFFDSLHKSKENTKIHTSQAPVKIKKTVASKANGCGFILKGKQFHCRNAIDVMIKVFETFGNNDRMFLERFASLPKHGRTRRYLAKTKEELYPGRGDLAQEFSTKLSTGWWLGTNYSRSDINKIIKMACEVAGINWGSEIIINLG